MLDAPLSTAHDSPGAKITLARRSRQPQRVLSSTAPRIGTRRLLPQDRDAFLRPILVEIDIVVGPLGAGPAYDTLEPGAGNGLDMHAIKDVRSVRFRRIISRD